MSIEQWREHVGRWSAAAAAHPALAEQARQVGLSFAVRCGRDSAWVRIVDGAIAIDAEAPSFSDEIDFALVAERSIWERYWQPVPPPLHHNLFALLGRVEGFELEGSRERFAQAAHVVARLLELSRPAGGGRHDGPREPGPDLSAIAGRYVRAELADGPVCIFVEEAGTGHDLLFLHTAGADSRQYHHLMADANLRERWRMVAFDMPAHGRSAPPPGMAEGGWSLDTDRYVDCIRAAATALGLDRPVVLGCSMGGQICLELAYRHPDEFSAVVACQAAARIAGRKVSWAKHPRVNETLFVPEWIDGLMGPHTPPARRAEVRWGYSQGAHGVFSGDIDFYSGDWDATDRVEAIDTARCPVYMLTGEYDYSCTPEMSEATARRIAGADFRVLEGLGHFPMAEHPQAFLEQLRPVLQEIREEVALA